MPFRIRLEDPQAARTKYADGTWGPVATSYDGPYARRRDAERAMRAWPEDRMYQPVEIEYYAPPKRG